MSPSVNDFEESRFVGLNVEEAGRLAECDGWTVRVIPATVDAVSLELVLGRMTLLVDENDRVTRAWVEGKR